jgi:RNase P subunit RPR2
MNGDIPVSDDICSVYCPRCKEATMAVSFNLLVKAKKVYLKCVTCGLTSMITIGKDGGVEIENNI